MISFRPICLLLGLTAPTILCQDIAPKDSERDPVISSLSDGFGEEFAPGEITADPPSLMPLDSGTPVLVTGTPPAGAEIEEEMPAVPEPEGVTVQIEPGKGAGSKVEAGAVKLLAPFPAKPLFQPPTGWRLEHPQEVPAFVREVTLSSGTRISLSIRPHLLVPDADGEKVLAIQEPGYDPAMRYAQAGTITAVLSSSVERMDEDSKKLGDALDRLNQLLSSLPAPEAPPAKETSPEKKPR